MAWKLPNGKVTRVPRGVQVGDTKYSASIFRRWSKEELNAIGIYPYREIKYNSKWYRSSGKTEEIIDGEIVVTHETAPKMSKAQALTIRVDELKRIFKGLFKIAKEEIAYYQAVEDAVGEQEWVDFQTALKAKAKQIRNQINNGNLTYKQITEHQIQMPDMPSVEGL